MDIANKERQAEIQQPSRQPERRQIILAYVIFYPRRPHWSMPSPLGFHHLHQSRMKMWICAPAGSLHPQALVVSPQPVGAQNPLVSHLLASRIGILVSLSYNLCHLSWRWSPDTTVNQAIVRNHTAEELLHNKIRAQFAITHNSTHENEALSDLGLIEIEHLIALNVAFLVSN